MKITSVECLPVYSGWRKNFVFVRIATDAGVVGWGEAYSQYDRDRAVAAQVEELGRYLVGRDPFHIRNIVQIAFDDYAQRRGSLEFYCATSGIEQALWDIVGKVTQQPVYNLLGGPCRSRIRVYANGWSYKMQLPEDYARGAEAVLKRGFTALKFDPIPGPWRTYREGHTCGSQCRRPGSRYSHRGPPAPCAHARHRSCQCARRVRALLVRGTLPVGERRGACRGPPREPHSGRERGDAAHARGFPPNHPSSRCRHPQSRRCELRRDSRTDVHSRGS